MKKMCVRCKETKSIDCYNLDASKRDGHGSYCKTCAPLKRREYYEKNAERLKKYSRDFFIANPEKRATCKITRATWIKNNRDVLLEKKRDRHASSYKNNPEYACNCRIRAMLKRTFASVEKPDD